MPPVPASYRSAEAGFSSVEVLVALVLLVSVWVPLVHFGVVFLGKPHNARTLTGLVLGRSLMERTLHTRDFVPTEYHTADGKWRLRRHVVQQGRRVVLRVVVYRVPEPTPRIRLMTVRLTSAP